jgi:hypothetical protein
MKLKSTTTLAALVLIGVGGFMAGRISSPADKDAAGNGADGSKISRPQASSVSASEASAARKAQRPTRPERGEMSDKLGRLARLEAIVRGENPLERNRALLAFLNQLGPGEFEEAVAHFRSLGITEARMGEYSLLLTAWAQADPTAALAFAKENTRNGFAQDTILTTWATTDPEAAIRWAQSNHEGEGPNPYLPGIIRGLAQTDPDRAGELLTSMPRSDERGKGLDFFLPHLLQQGGEAARAWISALTDDSLKNGAILRAANQLAETDAPATAQWLLDHPGQGAQWRLDEVYDVWAKANPSAAMSAYQALPPGEMRVSAFRGLMQNATNQDPAAGVALMDKYPNDVGTRAVQQFVWSSFDKDPALATSQIQRITDTGEQERLYRRTLDAWLDRDSAAAEAWIANNTLPPSVSERLARRRSERQ